MRRLDMSANPFFRLTIQSGPDSSPTREVNKAKMWQNIVVYSFWTRLEASCLSRLDMTCYMCFFNVVLHGNESPSCVLFEGSETHTLRLSP